MTLGQARGAILGGCVLVALVILAEYGAFEILGYQTFTTEIFTEFNVSFDVPSACALSLVLVVLGLVSSAVTWPPGGAGWPAPGPGPAGGAAPPAGRATVPVLAGFVVLVGAALGVPIFTCVYWMFEGGAHALAGVSIASAAWHTAFYCVCAAALATAMAFPLALLAVRHPGRWAGCSSAAPSWCWPCPGYHRLRPQLLPPALRQGLRLPQRPAADPGLRHPLLPAGPGRGAGLGGLRPGAPRGGGPLARAGRLAVFPRVTLPLIGPGIAAAFCLVFLAAVTELTATLILIPTGVQTLATQFWAYQGNLSYGQAAPFALVMIAIAALPSYVLGRYFDRLPARATRTAA